MTRLNEKTALVTGGATGLGRAIAQRLAAEGARVVISDIDGAAGRSTAAQDGFVFVEQDVGDEAQWSQVVGEVERRYGQLNILVNNAGIVGPMSAATPENTQLKDWRRIFTVNVEGVFLGCRAAISAMRRAGGGSIINVSSTAGVLATPGGTAYGASKAAVRHLTKSVAQYCAEQRLNIRCNSVHPGVVRTQLLDKLASEMAEARGISTNEVLDEFKVNIPLGDFILPEDIAAAVAFLASDDARRMTGARLLVDGGRIDCDSYRPGSKLSTTAAPSHQIKKTYA